MITIILLSERRHMQKGGAEVVLRCNNNPHECTVCVGAGEYLRSGNFSLRIYMEREE